MALAFVKSLPSVSANIIGATSMEQLRNNIDSNYVKLSTEVLAEIEAVYRRYPVPY